MRKSYAWDGARIVDVALVPSPYAFADSPPRRPIVHFDKLYTLAPDVLLGPVEDALAERVADASTRRGENFNPNRIYGFPYAFIHDPAAIAVDNALAFDPDARLFAAVAMSRLVQPTSAGFEYCARLRQLPDKSQQIIPVSLYHLNPAAFVIDPGDDWLAPADVPAIAALFAALQDTQVDKPNRVRAALWYHESGSRSYYFDVTWGLFTTGLESLIRIKDEKTPGGKRVGSTQAFVHRLLMIGALDPSLGVSEADLRAMYGLRSAIVHGIMPAGADAQSKELLRKKQALLRGILRKALTTPDFAAIFSSDAALKAALPML